MEKKLENVPNKDGFIFEELGELYFLLSEKNTSKKYFQLAYDILSQDERFKSNEALRLQRIKTLSTI